MTSAQRFLSYARTQDFGPTDFPGEPPGHGYPHFHLGVDYAAPRDTPIVSFADGTVTHAGWDDSGYGELVVVRRNNGLSDWFGHLGRVDVGVGQRVAAGEQLGLSDNTGNSTGDHVHWGVQLASGEFVDPLHINLPGGLGQLSKPGDHRKLLMIGGALVLAFVVADQLG